jgi:glucan phosphorylase
MALYNDIGKWGLSELVFTLNDVYPTPLVMEKLRIVDEEVVAWQKLKSG